MTSTGSPVIMGYSSADSQHPSSMNPTSEWDLGPGLRNETATVCPNEIPPRKGLLTILTAVTTILIFFGNLLMAVVISRTKKLRTPQGCMLLSIAIADFIVGVQSLMGFLTMLTDRWPTNRAGCAIMGYATSVSVAVTMYTLALMSVDRWIAIHWPFKYNTVMNRKRALTGILLMWVVSFLVYVPYFFDQIGFTYVCETHMCILDLKHSHVMVLLTMSVIRVPSLTIIILCTIHTCRTAHLHAKQIHSLEKGFQNNQAHGNHAALGDAADSTVSNKHIKTTFLLIGAFMVTWLPLYFLQLAATFGSNLDIPQEAMFIATWLIISNSYVNWIICLATDAIFRQGVKTLIKDVCCCILSKCQAQPDALEQSDEDEHFVTRV